MINLKKKNKTKKNKITQKCNRSIKKKLKTYKKINDLIKIYYTKTISTIDPTDPFIKYYNQSLFKINNLPYNNNFDNFHS